MHPDEEDDEEEYENDYDENQDEDEDEEDEEEEETEEIETMENSNCTGNSFLSQQSHLAQQQHNNSSKYDYGTDNEDEEEGDQPDQQLIEGDTAEFSNGGDLKLRILQTEISQEDFNNFLHKCTLNLPPQLSQKFVRLSKEFNNNIDYIMNYVYRLVGTQ